MIFIIWSGAAVAGDDKVVGLCEVDVADLTGSMIILTSFAWYSPPLRVMSSLADDA